MHANLNINDQMFGIRRNIIKLKKTTTKFLKCDETCLFLDISDIKLKSC